MPEPPPGRKVCHWKTARWTQIRGELKAALKGWQASSFDSVDDTVDDLYSIINAVVDRSVESSEPRIARTAPWWN